MLCRFSRHGSVVDKNAPGRRVRVGIGNCRSLLVGRSLKIRVSWSATVDKESQAVTKNEGDSAPARQNPSVDDGGARDLAVKKTASGKSEHKNRKSQMIQESRFIFFTQDQINDVDNTSMHPRESLEARQKLAYKLMALREGEDVVEMDEDGEKV